MYMPRNSIQESVLKGPVEVYLITLRALGIVGKLLTGSWLRFVETIDNILEQS